jgi:hypothetical protein
MSKTIANLAEPLVLEELESVLDSRHYQIYQQVYNCPEIRQKLISRVLKTVPACYAMVESDYVTCTVDASLVPGQLRHQLRAALMNNIHLIIEERNDEDNTVSSLEMDSADAPSNWFG